MRTSRLSTLLIGICTLGVSLGAPGLLLAQEAPEETTPEAATPAPPEQAPAPADEASGTQAPAPQQSPSAEGDAAPPAAPTPAAAPKGSASVSMIDFAFSPATVTINVGDSVTWTNNGQEDHTATGNSFDTGTVQPGGSRTIAFQNAGTFPYVCVFHAGQRGTVLVRAPGAGPTSGGGDTGTADPTAAAPGSEAAAVASADAAGTGDALPATGESEAPLLILGAGLLGCGALVAALARQRLREGPVLPPAA